MSTEAVITNASFSSAAFEQNWTKEHVFRTLVVLSWYFDTAVFLASSSRFPCNCGIPRYL